MLLINRSINYLYQSLRLFCLSSPPTTISSEASLITSSPTVPQQSQQLANNCINESIFETLITLIVSCKLNVSSKLFSRSSTCYFSPPNENVSFFDASIPATLPIVNRSCLKLVIKSALALHSQINPICSFDREHIFNPVNPSGYRLVQSRHPIASNGYIQVPIIAHAKDPGHIKTFECKSIHLEEDCGSTAINHLDQYNGINLNSRGLPIVKFVFRPSDITPGESVKLINELLLILKRIGATNGRFEEKMLSIDAKVQLIHNSNPCEPVTITNCHSHTTLAGHISHEIGRQKSLLKRNQPVPENYLFLGPLIGGLKPIRSTNYDTRTMVEPSLPPFSFLSQKDTDYDMLSLKKLTVEMPMLPEEERLILVDQFGLPLYQAQRLIVNNYSEIFIKMISKDESLASNCEQVCSFIMTVIEKSILLTNYEVDQLYQCVDHLVECYHLLSSNKILRPIAIKMICSWLEGGEQSPQELISSNDWSVIDDDSIIEEYCKKVIEDRSTIAFLVKRGDKKFLNNLALRVKIASNHRISADKILAKLEQLIDSIDKFILSNFVSSRNKTYIKRPKLFKNNND